MADGEKGIDLRVLISLAVLGLATLFQLIAIASNRWVDTISDEYGTIGYNGLWQTCTNMGRALNSCRAFMWEDVQVSHWFRTVQALEVIGWILGTTALGMMLLYHFVATCFTNMKLRLISIVFCILTFCCVISGGIVLWSLNDVQRAIDIPSAETYMSWSFGLSMTSSILYLFSGIGILVLS